MGEKPGQYNRAAPLEIRTAYEEAQEAAQLARARDASDYQALAEAEAQRNDQLRHEIAQLKDQIRTLRQQLYRVQVEDAWTEAEQTVAPDSNDPPESVETAVQRARTMFAGLLRFGGDVSKGVRDVSAIAGPPEKVFNYLKALAGMATARRNRSLGDSMMGWLSSRNVSVSDESKTKLNDRDEMKRRTWDDGAQRREFRLHLKPTEATQPDRCVRIYFDWDDASEQVVIGWVGRHP
ncbi:MAG: hypothetical protein ACT4QD_19450 [Acidobacteriota bacterium]